MKISIKLPFFPGFYESELENSDTSYWAINNELEYYQDELVAEHPEYRFLTEEDLDFDYRAYEKDIVEAFVEVFASNAPDIVKSVEFDEMVSPKYYNFSTDEVYAYVELADDWKEKVRAFMSENYEWLKKRIHEDWTSYDGFISFMENHIEDWDKMLFEEEDERYISAMIGYMMYHKNADIRGYLIDATLDGDIYPECYVFITETAKQRLQELIDSGKVVIPDPNQLKIPFEY